MNISKFNPTSWFRKEQQTPEQALPVRREEPWPMEGGLSPFEELHREMDRLFDSFAGGMNSGLPSILSESPLWSQASVLRPKVDIAESEKEYTVTVELPGVNPDDVKVERVGDSLRIWGEKKQEHEEKKRNYQRVERTYGSFQRILSLPPDANGDSIEAKFKNGVMTIAIPRVVTEATRPKRIEVKSG